MRSHFIFPGLHHLVIFLQQNTGSPEQPCPSIIWGHLSPLKSWKVPISNTLYLQILLVYVISLFQFAQGFPILVWKAPLSKTFLNPWAKYDSWSPYLQCSIQAPSSVFSCSTAVCLLLEWDLTLPWTSLMRLPISRTLTYPLPATGPTNSDISAALSRLHECSSFFPGSHSSAHLQGFIASWMEQLDDKNIFNICRYNASFPNKNRHYSGGWFWLASSTKAMHLFREPLVPSDPRAFLWSLAHWGKSSLSWVERILS